MQIQGDSPVEHWLPFSLAQPHPAPLSQIAKRQPRNDRAPEVKHRMAKDLRHPANLSVSTFPQLDLQ